ncbi:YhcB family protein [Thalassotalea agariperforans]
MTVVFIILGFIAGIIAGAFGFKMLASSAIEQKQLAEKVASSEKALAQYKLDVAEHLDNSASLLAQMNNTCQAAMKQMEESTQLLKQATPLDMSTMPFFSKETQEQLAETVSLRHKKESNEPPVCITEPPLDYSGQATGLFDDKKQPVTKAS